ncbi:MAG TPA: hypothetical protein VNI02_02525 [Blastocatellia bacterium]|jgi:hypothetical protein|nr:hypothetical protein [Blastocatellia bacterium]
MKCIACGSTALVEGGLTDGSGTAIFFKPNDAPLLKRVFGLSNRGVRAYGCVHCQHLQLSVEFDESDLERYQRFEGEQPGVLERIGAGPEGLEE